MKSYEPEELFDRSGRLRPELLALAPEGQRRMGRARTRTGACSSAICACPTSASTRSRSAVRARVVAEATRVQGEFVRDVMKLNAASRNFRVFSPDETASNRWTAVFEASERCSTAESDPLDQHVAPDGRVMEFLSEHMCQGWLEGYLLTGRHGFFSCYEPSSTSWTRCSTSTPSG